MYNAKYCQPKAMISCPEGEKSAQVATENGEIFGISVRVEKDGEFSHTESFKHLKNGWGWGADVVYLKKWILS